jgi:hypothetical protein
MFYDSRDHPIRYDGSITSAVYGYDETYRKISVAVD